MKTLFNDGWFFAELAIDENTTVNRTNPEIENENSNPKNKSILSPDDFFYNEDFKQKLDYKKVCLPHDWMILHVKDLYKNSVGFYKKNFNLSDIQVENRRNAIRFEGVYMNCAVWINGKKAGEWKYGYSTFEFDISDLVCIGENTIEVIAVYQNCNTRWYSGAGIFRDVTFINTPKTFLVSDGTYIVNRMTKAESKCPLNGKWSCKITAEIAGEIDGHTVRTTIATKDGRILAGNELEAKEASVTAENACAGTENACCGGEKASVTAKASSFIGVKPAKLSEEESRLIKKNVVSVKKYELHEATQEFEIDNPELWDTENPYFYISTTELLDKNGNVIDSITQHCGFKTAIFTSDDGFFLNGRKVKIYGACHHHDQGALGSAFDVNALRRQFNKLKEMGVNSVRCSHNPPPSKWMDLADEMGIMIDDEAFDMWEKPKTQFDYGNYFNEWCEKDTVSWVRRDRNHPSLIMWSIGNEIYDTHMGNGYEITKKLYDYVSKNDPEKNGQITIASNYMMTDGAQHCAQEIDTVGYNYLERLYDEHHEKYPEWKIYGSETGSTVQSRGIYHFPDTLKLVTFSDMQCSTLGNCTTTWGCANTQTVISNDRDCKFSAGQYIWTGWDYIGEPTPYHSKNSYFGQIDTAGFPKDTFYLYKSEWAYKKTAPFVHILPYWDWNEGQIIDVKAYTNGESVELFFNGKSLGKININHADGKNPFGQWQLAYHKGELKAVAYDENGNEIASETKRSFGDPAKIILEGEKDDTGNLYFIDVMTADKNGTLVENARNYITVNVEGDAELVGMDNGDSTDYDEYVSKDGKSHTRKLFGNRLVAIIRGKNEDRKENRFTVTAASKDLPNASQEFRWDENDLSTFGWHEKAADNSVKAQKDFVPTRKIEIRVDEKILEKATKDGIVLNPENREINVVAKVFPENASIKEINWNPVLKECVSSDYISVCDKKGENSGTESVTIKAMCDGQCILRCTAKNGCNHDEVLSDLNFSVEGIGNPKLNPYKLIEACRFDGWDESKGKPTVSLESGISNRGIGPTWISFDKVDFGKDGADTIHLPIFSFDTDLPVEIWDNEPACGVDYNNGASAKDGSECLLKTRYKHESVYNTFSENVFVLKKRLFGVHKITVVLPTELVFHGFYFDRTLKALSKLRALDADDIVGDSFTKTEDAVVGIGNNVNLDFANMDFGNDKASKLTVCGKSNSENNTINVKFFNSDGTTKTEVIEFAHTSGYEEKTFDISPISGAQKVSFVFLPGCNFDFKWFKFE